MKAFNEMKAERLAQVVAEDQQLSAQNYNLVMGAVVLWGVLVNALICSSGVNIYEKINPFVFFILYFACVMFGTMLARKSDKPIVSFIGYNFVVVPIGYVVSYAVWLYGGIESDVVQKAFVYVTLITFVMIVASMLFPDFFAKLGGALLIALAALLVVRIIAMFIGYNGSGLSWIGAGIFSLYIGFDMQRAQQYPKTVDNAVDCALDIYLDIINLFLEILRIMGNSKKRS